MFFRSREAEAGTRAVAPVRATINRSLTEGDVDAIRKEVPTIKLITPIAQAQGQFVFGNQNWSSRVEGSNEHYLDDSRLED